MDTFFFFNGKPSQTRISWVGHLLINITGKLEIEIGTGSTGSRA